METYLWDPVHSPVQAQSIIQRNIAARIDTHLKDMTEREIIFSGDIWTRVSFETVIDFVRNILERWAYQEWEWREYSPLEVLYVDKILTYVQQNGIWNFLPYSKGTWDITDLLLSLQNHSNGYHQNLWSITD